ncbi:MAG: phosphate ABC transporter permease subunit PstC [Clostridiales Family XIII bacterium]|jgi:phosphate transport system permease protein|nr:phosphate ABC transporter permease subunit PstC [Clostridiales Family XIII bacterium]
MSETQSIIAVRKGKSGVERTMNLLFLLCGLTAVVCVVFMTLYMVVAGGPIIAKVGFFDFVFGRTWNPENSQFGIFPMIVSSIAATGGAVLIALPCGVLVAVFLAKLAPDRIAAALRALIDLLAGIPSVVYGLLGAILLVPLIFNLQTALRLPTSGNLLAAMLILVIMILPTIISVSETAIRAVPKEYEDAALALGSTRLQSIFKVSIPAAKSGIVAGIVLGTGRAIGEAMAVIMVAGNAAIMPTLLGPVRLLTTSIPIEWAYSSGTHRDALYGIGLALFVMIMAINTIFRKTLKKGGAFDDG